MVPFALILVLALVPIPVVYLFYHRYFSVKPSYLHHIEHFAYGSALALVLLLAGRFLPALPAGGGAAAVGFLSAALIEKAGAFVLILILMMIYRTNLMVLNLVTSAMLLGLGFATTENIMYAIAIRESVIIVRLLSAVPLHVLTCGLIGYHLAIMQLSGSHGVRCWRLARAMAVPFLFHGLYDTMLLQGGSVTYLIAPLLVALIMLMEFILSKSQTLPLAEGLRRHRLSLEDWVTIQREPQYERWILRSMGSKIREHVPFFRLRMGAFRTSVILVLIAAASASFFGHDLIIDILRHRLNSAEASMVFTLLPALYALNLFAIGVVNPKYFRYSLIKIPIIIDADASVNGASVKTITYHVTGRNCYLKTVDSLRAGARVILSFNCAGIASPPVAGEVLWDSHEDQKQLSGTLIRFDSRPPRFRIFLVRYYLYRVSRGLSFNLRLPGFRNVRQLFVRPVSVMQKEWRYAAGQRLFEQGDSGRFFYLIRKGEVDILKRLDTGDEVLMTTLGEGDIFGEMAIVGNQPRLATAVCRTDCLLAVAESDNLDALIDGNPVFALRLIKNFANRLQSSEEIMLKSMAGMDQDARRRERMLSLLVRMVMIISGLDRGDKKALKSADIDALADELNLEKRTVLRVINALIDLKAGSPVETALNIMLQDGRDR